ncbi:site-2 protease family protein [Actinomadura adrarensis]|uniref:Site-2 protease family protein n=1 Tax=Actinomadura adrarensis TaxID=1819600 RepID=A0ABW3CP34_9ACTN
MGTVHLNKGRSSIRPSPVFLTIVLVTVLSGLVAWRYGQITETPARVAVFAFVVAAWVVSLCLHEFGHAYFAFRSGDHSVGTRGYLTLNPAKYADPILSFAFPVLFILLGGIGLPGGAVWIDRHAIQGRLKHSLISLAGPLANIVFAGVLAALFASFADAEHWVFWGGVAFLAFLQVTAALINLLPIPGLDGFGIWEPYLPRDFVEKANQYGGYIFIGLLAALWLIPPVNEAFFDIALGVCGAIGLGEFPFEMALPVNPIGWGHALFEFWN